MGARDPHNLQRFIEAQEGIFDCALGELSSGSKKSHWMWFIFPQLAGLGRSQQSQYYGIRSLEEARAYLDHPLLGERLRRSVEALMPWAQGRSAIQILGPVDAMKLRSSLTLFDEISPGDIFATALEAFFNGADAHTLALLNARA